MWTIIGSVIVGTWLLCAIYSAVRAAQTARTPQGAVAWVVFLLSAPHFALPLYLFLGQHRFRGYLVTRRKSGRVIDGLSVLASEAAPAPSTSPIPYGPFEYCADMKAVRGNSGTLLIDGDTAFQAIFEAIGRAHSYVLVQFYIIRGDDLGMQLQRHLLDALKRGVSVRLMVDSVGSFGLPDQYCRTLRDAGAEVVDRGVAKGPTNRFQINFRNHRKTVIVDGTVGFTGGLNVGDEYVGKDAHFGHWRDTQIKINGPMVSQLQLIFAEDWHWATSDLLLDELNWKAPYAPQDAVGLIVATGPADETETGSLLFFSAISAARHRIWIASPYFVPDIDVVAALRNAALRGVDVRILVPEVIDHRISWLAAFAYFDDIREAGVRVFRYANGFMHQKVFLVDDDLAAVGTSNLDNRSFRLNFEAMALFFDTEMAAEVERMLLTDFNHAQELARTLAEQRRYIRYGAPIARLFSPLL